MAEEFNNAGIPSVALTGNSEKELRNDISRKLINGDIKIIFTVDLFNEGVDIPQINTVLFLRPTESLTVFLQQLGRGLRLCKGKDCLTVLDFIGQSNKNYDFTDKFRALLGKTKNSVESYVKDGFNTLTKGCFIKLEKQAKEYVLRNIKGLKNSRDVLISKMKYFQNDTGKELNLKNFLEYANITLEEFYKSDRTFTKLKVAAEIIPEVNCKNEDFIARRIPVLLSMDSPKLIRFAIDYINNPDIELDNEKQILLNMVYYTFYSDIPSKLGIINQKEAIKMLVDSEEYKEEILEILNILFDRINCLPVKNNYDFINPLEVHSTYTLAQIMASFEYFNENNKPSFREGVKYFEDKNLDIFLVTLNKSDKDFSEATLYEDYAINDILFHWQSQNRDSQESKNIRRYIQSKGRISLFVRDYKKENGITSPYMYLGECEYVKHSGNKPVSFVWKLKNPIPGKFISEANKNVL